MMTKPISSQALCAAALMAVLGSFPLAAQSAAGVAQFTYGEVQVQRSGNNVPLRKGDAIESGDVLNTGPQGRAQVRFTDGGIMSLSPDSRLVIQRYNDAKDGAQDSFLVNFVRGGLRAVTGLIGKRNRDNYKVQTAASTIGIRGSGFSSVYNPDGTVTVSGELDEIEVCTKAGCVGLGAGQSVVVQSNDILPLRTSPQANLELPDLRQTITIAGNHVDNEGKPLIVSGSCTNSVPDPSPIESASVRATATLPVGAGCNLFSNNLQ